MPRYGDCSSIVITTPSFPSVAIAWTSLHTYLLLYLRSLSSDTFAALRIIWCLAPHRPAYAQRLPLHPLWYAVCWMSRAVVAAHDYTLSEPMALLLHYGEHIRRRQPHGFLASRIVNTDIVITGRVTVFSKFSPFSSQRSGDRHELLAFQGKNGSSKLLSAFSLYRAAFINIDFDHHIGLLYTRW